jgi:hypothetical protein
MSIRFTQGNLPKLTDTLTSDGVAVNLTSATLQLVYQLGALSYTKTAALVSAAEGRVEYQFVSGDTDTPGVYQAQWVVDRAGVKSNFPTDPFTFEIVPGLPLASGVTPISDFYETIRFLIGDRDTTVQMYSDAVLLQSVRSCIRLQKISGYAVTADLKQITPAVTDVNAWALVAYHTVKAFVDSHPDKYSYKTRAIGESFGSWRNFLDELKLNIYKLENGTMFSGWQNYYTWLSGVSGLPLEMVMANLTVRAPWISVGLSTDGISVSGS